MIKPTNGRVVWYTPSVEDRIVQNDREQPLAAIVAHAWNDRMVNLMVIDSNGNPVSRTSVPLLQAGDERPTAFSSFAEWMPYQKGQAAKTEALEQKLATPPA